MNKYSQTEQAFPFAGEFTPYIDFSVSAFYGVMHWTFTEITVWLIDVSNFGTTLAMETESHYLCPWTREGDVNMYFRQMHTMCQPTNSCFY